MSGNDPSELHGEDVVAALKVSANPVRLQLLEWLRDPDEYFAATISDGLTFAVQFF